MVTPPSHEHLRSLDVFKRKEYFYQTIDYKLPYEDLMQMDQPIHQHLVTLYFLVKEFRLKTVLELGTQYGYSTCAFGYAVKEIDGHLYSMDIASCPEAEDKMEKKGLSKNWTLYRGDDLILKWDKNIDCLLIDSHHSYEQVKGELRKYEHYVNKNGFIMFHDNLVFKGIQDAINEYMEPLNYNRYRWFNDCGLEVWRKR